MAQPTFPAQILTPEGVLYEGQATGVKVPGANGQFEVLSGHAPILSSLESGRVSVRGPEGERHFHVTGGFVEVNREKLTLLAESATPES